MTADGQLDIIHDFIERGRKAQEELNTILQASDVKARVRPRARSTDPSTSHRAARKAGEQLNRSQQAVYECMEQRAKSPEYIEQGGLTDPQLVAAYHRLKGHGINAHWPVQSDSGIRTRRKELVRGEMFVKAGETKTHTLWRLA